MNQTELNSTPSQEPLVHRRIPALDGIRGLAVLSVILFHGLLVEQETTVDTVLFRIREPLWCGVDLFFVLSGFLITGILLETRSTRHYFQNFFARRVLRIFPLYYGVLVGLFVILPLAGRLLPQVNRVLQGDYYSQLWDNQIWLWSYLQNFLQARGPHRLPGLGHFWTLALEEQFYLVWPFVVYMLSRRALLWTSVAICSVVCLLRPILLANGVDEWAVRHLTYTRVDTMLYGAIAAIIVRDARLLIMTTRHSRLIAIVLGGVIASTAWTAGGLAFGHRLTQIFVYPSLGMLFALGILGAVVRDRDQNPVRLLNLPVLTTFGKYSYAMYVFHWPIVHGARALVKRLSLYPGVVPVEAIECLLVTLLTFAVTLPLSILSWYAYERHWLNLKRYFSYEAVPHAGESAPPVSRSDSNVPEVVAISSPSE